MLQSNEIIHNLENKDFKEFIFSNLENDTAALSLKFSGKTSINLTLALQLIAIYQKAKKKLPSHIGLAITPKSYEQATSEKVATFKATLFSGNRLIDACGGLGIDDLAFAKRFNRVISYDLDEDLNILVRYNLNKLGVANVQRRDGAMPLELPEVNDVLYIDPDRRSAGSRSILLNDMQPDVIEILNASPTGLLVMIKLSPLFEVKQLIKELNGIHEVYAISEGNDLKEVLITLKPGSSNLEIQLIAVELGAHAYEYRSPIGAWDAVINKVSEVRNYLHIAGGAMNKLHLSTQYFANKGAEQLGEFEIYQSNDLIEGTAHQSFKVEAIFSLVIKKLKKELNTLGIQKAEIIVKGHSLKSHLWYAKLGLQAGGDHTLFMVFGSVSKAILCKRS